MDRLIRNSTTQETKTQDNEDHAFGNAFQNHAELSEAVRPREQEIRQRIDGQLQVEFQEQAANRSRVGDAVGTDGDRLYVRGTDGEAPIPGTEAHAAWLR